MMHLAMPYIAVTGSYSKYLRLIYGWRTVTFPAGKVSKLTYNEYLDGVNETFQIHLIAKEVRSRFNEAQDRLTAVCR